MIHRIKRATRILLFYLLVFFAIGLSLIRLSLLAVENYRVDLEKKIYELTSIPISIGKLHASMRGINPEIILKDIKVLSVAEQGQPPIQLKQVRVGIDLIQLLLTQKALPSSWLTFVGLKLSIVRKIEGGFSIIGLNSDDSGQPFWLLSGGRYEVLKSDITWLDEKTGGEPLNFKNVDLVIKNATDGQSHELHLLSQLPERYGKKLRVSLSFKGNIFKENTVNGHAYVEGTAIHLSEFVADGFPLDIKILSKDVTDFKLWGDWKNSKLDALLGTIETKNIVLHKNKKTLQIDKLSTQISGAYGSTGWQFGVADFNLRTKNRVWPTAEVSFSSDQALTLFTASAIQLDLQEMALLTDFFAPLGNKNKKLLANLNLKGRLKNTTIFADIKNQQYAINGAFEQVFIDAFSSFPKIENFSGVVKGSNERGQIYLNTEEGRAFFPSLFREAFSIKKLTGLIKWEQLEKTWSIQSDLLVLDTPDIQTESSLSLLIPKDNQSVFMDLQTSFANGPNISHAPIYYPVNIIDKGLVSWLDTAFVSGKITKGGLIVYGELNQFPFTKNQGMFEVLFNAEDVQLNFSADWPHLNNLNTDILFLKNSLTVNINQAKTEQLTIKQAVVKIPSFDESSHLFIQGKVRGDILNGLQYMQKTPLHKSIDAIVEAITPKGFTQVNLDLKIPLVEGGQANVDGTAYFNDAELTLNAIELNVTQLTGDLKITEEGMFTENIKAYMLGYPVTVQVDSDEIDTSIIVNGITDIVQLKEQFSFLDHPFIKNDRLTGSTPYSAVLELPYAVDSSAVLSISSNLIGVSSHLPESFKKTAEEESPLQLKMILNETNFLPFTLNLNNQLNAAITIDKQQGTVYSADIVYGKAGAVSSTEKGMSIQIEQDSFDASAWLGLAQSAADEQDSTLKLNKISLKTKDLFWSNNTYGLVEMTMQRVANSWQGRLDSDIASGLFVLPIDKIENDKIVLSMDSINLSALMALKTVANQYSAAMDMPLIDLSSEQLWWNSVNLGRLEIETEKILNGIEFKHINVTARDHKVGLQGRWVKINQGSVTELFGDLVVHDLGQLLSQLDISQDLKESSAKVEIASSWGGLPYQFSLSDITAEITLALGEGRISSIEPGFGRLLGLVAMEQWIKRLSLDFGDVFNKGLTFNDITGRFLLQEGTITTDDLVVDAIPARMSISGEANLLKKTLDHKVKVVPKSSAAIPIAGTIVGGIAGAITQVFTDDYKEGYFFGSEYRINGSWDDIKITPLSDQEGLINKTWSGLTDFSWMKSQKINNEK